MDAANIKYTEMDWADGSLQLPGIKKEVYAIAKRNIVGWPTLGDTVTTAMGELAAYAGSFTLAANKKWQKVGVVIEESPVKSNSQGSKPSKTFLVEATFQHNGVGQAATGFARQANNDDLVYLVNTKTNEWRVIGNEIFESNTDVEQDLGGAVTGKMGTKITVKVTDVCPAPFYTGEIVTEAGIINDGN